MLKILNDRLRMLMLTVVLASSANCFSQDYPNKPIRLVIPTPIIEELNAAVRTALADPEVLAKLAKFGAQPMIQSTQQFADLIQSDSAKWAQVLAAGNIKAD